MAITDPMVLAPGVSIVRLDRLPGAATAMIAAPGDHFAVFRAAGRATTKVVGPDTAALLETFREPHRVVDAVLAYCGPRNLDPQDVLSEAYAVIRSCLNARFLIPANARALPEATPVFRRGDRIDDLTILRCVQVMDDAEVYQVRGEAGDIAALKIVGWDRSAHATAKLRREAAALRRLGGTVAPRLVRTGVRDGRAYLVMAWCSGAHPYAVVGETVSSDRAAARDACGAILRAYAALHEAGVVHGDVHPANLVVRGDGSAVIIDFGLARVSSGRGGGAPPRGGVGYYLEPEYARAVLAGAGPPGATAAGDQFAVAAVLYRLIAGSHYVDFALDRDRMLAQIAADAPLPFSARGVAPWPEAEAILGRALSKDPSNRFPTMRAFQAAWDDMEVTVQAAGTRPARPQPVEALVQSALARLGQPGRFGPSDFPAPDRASAARGAAGVAWVLYRDACSRDDPAMLSAADVWIHRAGEWGLPGGTGTEATAPHDGLSGVTLIGGLIAQAAGDRAGWEDAAAGYASHPPSPDSVELRLGCAGTLIGTILLLEAAPDPWSEGASQLRRLGDHCAAAIADRLAGETPAAASPPLANLGMAHGWAGMLYALLRWCRHRGDPVPEETVAHLDRLAACAEPWGRGVRWPWRSASDPEDGGRFMAGWCNGSAGFVFLWTLAHQLLGRPAYAALADAAAWHAWEAPASSPHLCCGVAGRAYALLNRYRHSADTAWLDRARALADRGAHLVATTPPGEDRGIHSLFDGELGLVALGIDLRRPEAACMPLLEPEGWPAP